MSTEPLRLAVIGDPIDHSRSPAIHTAALAATGIEGRYVARRVNDTGMETLIAELRRGGLAGVNVTMPLKGVAAALVDELSPDARRSLAVNTIVRKHDGSLVGHNTDVTALRRLAPGDPTAPCLVLGAGGAAASAVLALSGRPLYVSARRPGSVAALSSRLGVELLAVPWGGAVVEALVVNATPVGMRGEELPERTLALAGGLVDLAYGMETTPAVEECRRSGVPTVDGVEFLVAQAADSFRLWTGREAPLGAMLEAATNFSSAASPAPND